ncbi:hypothetical protein CCACVL1_01765 [Corchorus capsularis]|uniref:Uncharacterized protein n=1 Tax=Corchorus capsularis TaxID=210143 RepID=A0A1R3KFV8_COCAP|nr:hypothetical protein CCACVL1_01765 [Corchorus capsularis]
MALGFAIDEADSLLNLKEKEGYLPP